MLKPSITLGRRLCLLLLPAVLGCHAARQIHDSEYAELVRPSHLPAVAAGVPEAVPPVMDSLAGKNSLDTYIEIALAQNPEIHAARKSVEAMAYVVPQVSSLQDPMLGVTLYPEPIQTAAGQQELQLTANQRLPWFGKLRTRAAVAEQDVDVARAQLAAAETAVIEQVKRAYYELYLAQRSLEITESDRELLLQLTQIAEARLRTGSVSQQDVLRAQLEVSNLDTDLVRLRQQLDVAQARMTRLLHISPDTEVRAAAELVEEQIPRDVQRLYEQAIVARPELHEQLATVVREQRNVDLARLDYFPDVTLGATWIDTSSAGISPVRNGRDSFLVNMTVNLPVYGNRIEAGVRQAEAQAVASARRYDALRDATVAEVKQLFVEVQSQQELARLFRDEIVPRAEQTLRVSTQAYRVGDVDFLQLIDNWRQLLRFQIGQLQVETQLRQSLATLERVVGTYNANQPGDLVEPVEGAPVEQTGLLPLPPVVGTGEELAP